jgi:hypothetical protein
VGTITLYRAVSPQELIDILSSNVFRVIPSALQGKWFAEDARDTAQWGIRFWRLGGGPFHIVQVLLPEGVADQMYRLPNLDRIGPARYAEGDVLESINQNKLGITEVPLIATGVP